MGVVAVLGYEPKTIMGIPSIETGVFGGILIGAIAGWLFNRYFRLQLPPYLGFFSGKRSVPILTALAAVAAGVVLSLVWPPIGRGIDSFSHWAASGNPGGGVRDLRGRRAVTHSLRAASHLERAVLLRGRHSTWTRPAARSFAAKSTVTSPAIPPQGISPAGICSRCGDCPLPRSPCGTAPGPRTARRSAAS